MNKFLIRTNEDKDEGLKTAGIIRDYLVNAGKEAFIEKIGSKDYTDTEPEYIPGGSYDCVIVIGGDGTMLRAARDFLNIDVPILGINLGSVGYLTEVNLDELDSALKKLVNDEYDIEERMMLEGNPIIGGAACGHAIALNDIAVLKKSPFQAISFDIYVNGQFLTGYVADGIIVSTPTGSTGYNLSAGGPIVEPPAKLMVMTPVCPHTINARSIILSADDEVCITIREGRDNKKQTAVAMADSANRFELKSGDCFVLRKSENRVKFVKLNKESFLKVLHDKLQ